MGKGGLTDSELSFYSTAAQVIPVLLLALALELPTARAVGHFLDAHIIGGWMWRVTSVVIFLIVCAMFVGELVALVVLRTDQASDQDETYVMVGLVAGAIPMFLAVLTRLMPDVARASSENRPAEPAARQIESSTETPPAVQEPPVDAGSDEQERR